MPTPDPGRCRGAVPVLTCVRALAPVDVKVRGCPKAARAVWATGEGKAVEADGKRR